MIRNPVLYLLLLLSFFSCDSPVSEKKADILHLEKVTRDTDVLTEHPGLRFINGSFSGFEFKDERFMRFYDIPVNDLRITVTESKTQIQRIAMELPKDREAIKALKEKLSKAFGQPGGDSSNDFSSFDEGALQVWKDSSRQIGVYTDKSFDTAAKIDHAPTVNILFVKPAETNY